MDEASFEEEEARLLALLQQEEAALSAQRLQLQHAQAEKSRLRLLC